MRRTSLFLFLLFLALSANSGEPQLSLADDTAQGTHLPEEGSVSRTYAVAADDRFAISKKSASVELDVLDNNAGTDSTLEELMIVAVEQTRGGGQLINNVSHLTYLPPTGFSGIDSFTYTVADQKGVTSTAAVFVKHMMPWRIMPIGDSITEASGSRNSYRRPLWHLLNDAGIDIDFVGSRSGNRDGQVPNPDFDTDHEGHWGWRADRFLQNNRIDNWAQDHQPDIALIHLGTNDIFQGQSVSGTIDEIGEIIDRLRVVNPDIIVLVAQIIPTSDPSRPSLSPFNQAIPGLASDKNTQRSPVLVVDQTSGFDAAADTYDDVHPNLSGETKMANQWNATLAPLISMPTNIDVAISPQSSSVSTGIGEDLQLEFSILNTGNATATGVEAVMTLPAESTLVSGPVPTNGANCTTSGVNLICNDDLNPGDNFSVSFAIEHTASGVFDLNAVVQSDQVDSNIADNTASIEISVENLAPVLSAQIPDADIIVGQSYTADMSSYFSDPDGETLAFTANVLPAGVQLAGTTGIISGTPTIAESTTVTLAASDAAGAAASDTFVIRVAEPSPPPPPTPPPAPPEPTPASGGGALNGLAIFGMLLLYCQLRYRSNERTRILAFTTTANERRRSK